MSAYFISCSTGQKVDFAGAASTSQTATFLVETLQIMSGRLRFKTLVGYKHYIPKVAHYLLQATQALGRPPLTAGNAIDDALLRAFAGEIVLDNRGGLSNSTAELTFHKGRRLLDMANVGQPLLPIRQHFAPPAVPPAEVPEETIRALDEAVKEWRDEFTTRVNAGGEATDHDVGMLALAIIRLSGVNLSTIVLMNARAVTPQPRALVQQKPRSGAARYLAEVPLENLQQIEADLKVFDCAASAARDQLGGRRPPFWVFRDAAGKAKRLRADADQHLREKILKALKRIQLPDLLQAPARRLRVHFQAEHTQKRSPRSGKPLDVLGHAHPGDKVAFQYLAAAVGDRKHFQILSHVTNVLLGENA